MAASQPQHKSLNVAGMPRPDISVLSFAWRTIFTARLPCQEENRTNHSGEGSSAYTQS